MVSIINVRIVDYLIVILEILNIVEDNLIPIFSIYIR
jgi:hypothetical protein